MIAKIRAIQLLSLAAVLLLLCSGLLLLGAPASGGEDNQQEAVYAVTEIPVSQVAAVTVVNEKMKFGVMNTGDQLEAVSSVTGNYSQTELRSLVYAASHLSGSRKITDLTNGDQYGMNNPTAAITIVKTDNSQISLSLLSKNSMDGNYYLYAEADQAVYLISPEVAGLFLRQESDFFSHTVLPVFDGNNFEQLVSLEMDFNGNGRNYTMVQSGGSFRLERPIDQKLPMMNVLQQLLLPVSALYSDGFVQQGANLSSLGFDEYTLKITMDCGGEIYEALLLDRGDGSCLMADARTGDVYELGSESLSPLLFDYTQLLSGKAFRYAAGDLKSVAAETGEGRAFAEISAEAEEGDGAAQKGSTLFHAVNDPDIASEVTTEERVSAEKQSASPALTMVFTLKSGSMDTVELTAAARGGYYVRVNGTVNFTTTESYFQKVKKAIADQQ